MNQTDLKIIVIEFSSSNGPLLLNDSNRDYYGDDNYQFNFKKYLPIRLKNYPERHFFYASYSQSELDELYTRVDMTYLVEPVDYLLYRKDLRGATPYVTFSADDVDMVNKLGKFEFIPLPKYDENLIDEKNYKYILNEIFADYQQEKEKKNYIIVFHSKNSMLGCIGSLLYMRVPKEQIRVGKVKIEIGEISYSWSLAVTGISDEVEKLQKSTSREDLQFMPHSSQTSAEGHGFSELPKYEVEEIFARM